MTAQTWHSKPMKPALSLHTPISFFRLLFVLNITYYTMQKVYTNSYTVTWQLQISP